MDDEGEVVYAPDEPETCTCAGLVHSRGTGQLYAWNAELPSRDGRWMMALRRARRDVFWAHAAGKCSYPEPLRKDALGHCVT